MWKNVVEPDRPQMTIRRMRSACQVANAKIDIPLESLTLVTFPWQQWWRERASMLRYTYTVLFEFKIGHAINSRPHQRTKRAYVCDSALFHIHSLNWNFTLFTHFCPVKQWRKSNVDSSTKQTVCKKRAPNAHKKRKTLNVCNKLRPKITQKNQKTFSVPSIYRAQPDQYTLGYWTNHRFLENCHYIPHTTTMGVTIGRAKKVTRILNKTMLTITTIWNKVRKSERGSYTWRKINYISGFGWIIPRLASSFFRKM
jgi:hypothetical protein